MLASQVWTLTSIFHKNNEKALDIRIFIIPLHLVK